jgi:amino acid adenylation domain-containing protein
MNKKSELLAKLLKSKGIKKQNQEVIVGKKLPVLTRDLGQPVISYAQQRLWFIDQLEKQAVIYTLPWVLSLEGQVNQDALAKSLSTIVMRHQSLRTVFVAPEGIPQPVVLANATIELPQTDITVLDGDAQYAEAERIIASEIHKVFDLSTDVLLRARLIKMSEHHHLLVLTMHHIASDGWSLGVLMHELKDLYCAFLEQQVHSLSELPVQYQDYSAWQRQLLKGIVMEEQLAYWEKQLASLPPLHSLPLDKPRPVRQTYNGAVHKHSLPEDLVEELRALSQAQATTLFVVMQTVWAVLISRCSGETDVVMGTPIANRPNTTTENMIGMFVNTLVLRNDLSGNPNFKVLLARSKAMHLAAQQYQDLPFDVLVERLCPSRHLAHSPLFQLTIVFNQQIPLSLSQLSVTEYQYNYPVSKFDLTLHINDGQSLQLIWEYNTDLFVQETISRFARHYERLLREVVAKLEQPVASLELLDGNERLHLLEWGTRVPDFITDSLVSRFESQVSATPMATSLRCGPDSLSYEQLNSRANKWAGYLRGQGVVDEQRVGLCLSRSVDLVVGIIAILKAGGAYVLLDPNNPPQRLAFLVNDAQLGLVLTEQSLQQVLPQSVNRVCMDGADELTDIAQLPCNNLSLKVTANNLAYVIYTSGSTGQPKGVMIEQGSVTRLVCKTNFMVLDNQIKMLQCASLTFDAATFEIWAPLLNGGELILFPSEYMDVARLTDVIEQYKVNTLLLTTALFDQWVVQLTESSVPRNMRYVMTGGDVVSPVSVKRLYQLMSKAVIINVYGPTENTTFTSCYPIPRDLFEQQNVGALFIGKATNGTEIFVLDEHHKLCPLGTVGELYVGGVGIARGYLGMASSKQDKFVTLAIDGLQARRLYRTGDKVRYRNDGNLEYWGRSDTQVKLRGFRVELGEIENCLAQHPAVSECVVVLRGNGIDKRLVAYMALFRDTPYSELDSHLRQSLPNYMIPAALVQLKQLPVTSNGKIDRASLPEPGYLDYGVEQQQVVPETGLEKALAQLWLSLLPVDVVSATGNFFEYGGHSLLASQLIVAIRNDLEVEMPVAVIFQKPTIRAQADWIEQNTDDTCMTALERHNGKAVMSCAQQRLWFIDQLEGQAATYTLPCVFALKGNLNTLALAQSLSSIVARHESLRTVFSCINGVASPIVLPTSEIAMAMSDVSQVTGHAQSEQIKHIIDTEIQKSFDLSRDLMLRACLIKSGEGQHLLVLTMHHIASDGWSLGILMKEMNALYGAYKEQQQNPLSALTVQYQDYSAWQQQWLKGCAMTEQLNYWQTQLAGLPLLHSLPLDKPRPSKQTYHGVSHKYLLPSDLVVAIRALAQSQGTTLFVVLQTTLAALFSRWSGETDIVMGTPIANRSYAATEDLIGYFANTLVLRNDVSDQPCFNTLLQRSKTMHQAAQLNQDLPFDILVEHLSPPRHLAHSPLFQLMIVFNQHNQVSLPGLDVSEYNFEYPVAKFDLTLNITDSESLSLLWEYNTDLFEATTIARLAEHFERLLRGVVSTQEQPVASLSLLDSQEQFKLLQWGEASANVTCDSLVTRFESQVLRTPRAIAVCCDSSTLSYEQLNAKANQWAAYLRTQGVADEQLVGLCVSRSINLVVAILAILKAGGAYVPLDPKNPHERLDFIIKDAALKLVVCEYACRQLLPQDVLTVSIDGPEEQATTQLMTKTDLECEITASDLAYIIYTSGSTGQPKGVMVEHGNVVRLFDSTEKQFQFNSQDSWTLFHSYAFDFSVWEMWGALLYGGKLVVVPYDLARSTFDFYELLKREQITVLNQTPSAFQLLNEIDSQSSDKLMLRYVIFGGEVLEPEKLQKWVSKYSVNQPALINMYGITETTVHVTYKKLEEADFGLGLSNIGKPLSDLGAYVCNDMMSLQPVGIAGELYVSGEGVTRGYLNRQNLNSERFITNPFSISDERKLYRTGDLVRWGLDGDLEYLGRIDQQVKLRGFRIELGEIENRLTQCKYVKECLVCMDRDRSGAQHLTAYIVPETDTIQDDLSDTLRAFLLQRLPDYMVPAYFVVLESFPLTNNGKLDKRALPKPDVDSGTDGEFVAPGSKEEQLLVTIWQQVLNKENIGITNNFFAIGGDSIKAVQVVALAIKSELYLQTRHMFEYQTIGELARYLSRNADKTTRVGLHAPLTLLNDQELLRQSKYSGTDDSYPLTCLQKMMLDEHRRKKMGTYHPQHLFEISATDFDEGAFITTIRQSIWLNPTLRTRFERLETGEYIQHVSEKPDVHVDSIDLSNSEHGQSLVNEYLLADKIQGFDYDQDELLIKFKLFKLSDECFQFLVSTHHAIEDGWGFVEWIKFIFVNYQRLKYNADYDNNIAAANVFKEHVALEYEAKTSKVDKDVWHELMKGYQQMPGLTYKNTSCVQDGIVKINLTTQALQQMTKLSYSGNMPLKTLFLHSYMKALAKFFGTQNVTVDVVFNGRTNRLSDPLNAIGLFWNMLPVTADLTVESLQTVKDKILRTEAHSIYPRDLIAAVVGVETLTHAAFNYVHFHNEGILANEDQYGVVLKYSCDKFHHPLKLLVSISPDGKTAELQIEFDKNYLDKNDAHQIKEYLEQELEEIQYEL